MYTNDLLQLQYLGVDLYHTSCIRHQSVFSFLGRCTHDKWLASAADRRAAINMDRNAAAFAARWTDRQTDGRPTVS